jgi:uncharacterized protein YigA (DUF484 family)
LITRTDPTFNPDALASLVDADPDFELSDLAIVASDAASPSPSPSVSAPEATAPSQLAIHESLVIDYLLEHREFFQEHAYLLKRLELPHTVGENTISLQAKQVNVLRQSLNANEARLEALLVNAKNNELIAQGLHQITLCLLAQRSVGALLEAVQESIAYVFGLQDTAVRLWGTDSIYHKQACNQPVSDDLITFAEGLKTPYCGTNLHFAATAWLSRPVASLGMVALRVTPNAKAFGLFIIGSQDAQHFSSDKNTAFLAQLGQILSASLGRMLPPYS